MSDIDFEFNNSKNDYNVNEAEKYTNILSVNKYEFLTNTYFGTGGYMDGTYLVPNSRELFYKKRKELSAYRNFMKPVVDSLLTPVFNKPATRIITDANGNKLENTMFETFLKDCDNNSSDIQSVVEQATMYARLHGVSFIVMDSFGYDVQPETINEAISSRIMPYIYIRKASDVEAYSHDTFGRIGSILFKELSVIVEGKPEERFMEWTELYSRAHRRNKDGKIVPIGEPVIHGLGTIPVIAAYSVAKKNTSDVLVDPPMYDLAKLNCQLYNKDSAIVDLERAQAFSVFYLQSDNGGNITLGAHNVVFLPMESTMAPGFATPPEGTLRGLVDNAETLKNSIFQIAQQNGVYGIQEAKSGLAMSYDFYAQEYQLHKTAQIAKYIEDNIARLFKLYTNEEFEYIVKYPDEYRPGNTNGIIATYKEVLGMGIPEEFKKAIYEKLAYLLFEKEENDRINDIIVDINKTNQQEGVVDGADNTAV